MKQLKNIALVFTLLIASHMLVAQGVVITDDASYVPGTSAVLDVNSTSKGLLPPRMSTQERDSITTPAEGLIIFNTNSYALQIYNGGIWSSATSEFICGSSQIADTTGNIYNTIKIGDQCWMAENLNIGTMIVGSVDQSDNSTLEKYCYNNNEDSCNHYGGLYQWAEMIQYTSKGSQGICPDGWHIPTDAEWCMLEKEVDLTIDCTTTGWRGIDAGTSLKQDGSYGFTSLLAGYRNNSGSYDNIGTMAYYWTSTLGSSGAWSRSLSGSNNTSARIDENKTFGFSVRCLKNITVVPTVITDTASNITATSGDCAGEIVDVGWSTITQYGHCWSMSPKPTVDDDLYNLGSTDTAGIFISNIHDLASFTTYYVRAYAINSEGVNYSADISFTTAIGNGAPCPGVATITHGGQLYNTVLIGDQCWLRENLNIGTMIDGSLEQTNNATIEKYCNNNETSNCDIYGGLYQWNEMMEYVTTEGAQGICPAGWHIPTNLEWCILEQFLDEATIICDPLPPYGGGIDAAGHLKMVGSTYWNFPNMAATNSSGFTAMPGCIRTTSGNFWVPGTNSYFWTSTEANSISAKARRLMFAYAYVMWISGYDKNNGYSARCIKD